jgi:hypothetical protein
MTHEVIESIILPPSPDPLDGPFYAMNADTNIFPVDRTSKGQVGFLTVVFEALRGVQLGKAVNFLSRLAANSEVRAKIIVAMFSESSRMLTLRTMVIFFISSPVSFPMALQTSPSLTASMKAFISWYLSPDKSGIAIHAAEARSSAASADQHLALEGSREEL